MSAKAVRAGTYVVTIKDLSSFHNFHLVGPGVDKYTSVQKVGTFKWTVKLRKGTYRFVCDPHSTTMKGTLKVS
jgi:plastocyanin